MVWTARTISMRLLLTALACATLGSSEVTVGTWNGMLLVTAPAGHDLAQLGGRLEQRISLDVRDQPLEETATFLHTVSGLNVVLDPALRVSGTTVTMQVRDMRLGNVLRWLERTAAIHIGWVNGALFLSAQPIAGTARTRLYDVSDLIMPVRDFPGPSLQLTSAGDAAHLLPLAAEPEARYDLDQLAELVRKLR